MTRMNSLQQQAALRATINDLASAIDAKFASIEQEELSDRHSATHESLGALYEERRKCLLELKELLAGIAGVVNNMSLYERADPPAVNADFLGDFLKTFQAHVDKV